MNNCHIYIHIPLVLSFLYLTCKISFILYSDPNLVSFSLYKWPITFYAVCNSIPSGKILLTVCLGSRFWFFFTQVYALMGQWSVWSDLTPLILADASAQGFSENFRKCSMSFPTECTGKIMEKIRSFWQNNTHFEKIQMGGSDHHVAFITTFFSTTFLIQCEKLWEHFGIFFYYSQNFPIFSPLYVHWKLSHLR